MMSSAQDMELLRRELEVVCREMIELRRLSTKPGSERCSDGMDRSVERNGPAGVKTAPGRQESRSA